MLQSLKEVGDVADLRHLDLQLLTFADD
jgi:hypothetical protein